MSMSLFQEYIIYYRKNRLITQYLTNRLVETPVILEINVETKREEI